MNATPARSRRIFTSASVVAVALVMAACGGSDDEASPTSSSAPSSVPSTTESTTPTTNSDTTSSDTTMSDTTTTSFPVSTSTSTSTASASTSSTSPSTDTSTDTSTTVVATLPTTTLVVSGGATTVAPATPTPPAGTGTAIVAADERLVEIDIATGDAVRVLDEAFSGLDGLFRGGLRLSPDRSTIWFSEGYEDGWYGCETSIGSYGRVDAASGAIEILGVGSRPEPSPDGALVAYVTSSLCLPDPESPEFWVLTPGDRVVVRTLATGDEREFVTDTAPANYDSASAVVGAVFGPDGTLLVQLGDGQLIGVDVDGSGVIQDHPVELSDTDGLPVAATADAVITLDFGDEGSTDVYSVDRNSGASTLLASTGAFLAVGVSAGDQLVVSAVETVTVSPGADVSVVEPSDGSFVYDIDW